jgi:hypothetical protein
MQTKMKLRIRWCGIVLPVRKAVSVKVKGGGKRSGRHVDNSELRRRVGQAEVDDENKDGNEGGNGDWWWWR